MKLLHKLRSILYRAFAGAKLGKRYPMLWRMYDLVYRLFSPRRFIHTVNGINFLIDMDEPDFKFRRIMQDYSWLKEYEPNTMKVLRENIKEGDTILDVGASLGILTIPMAKFAGATGCVIAIEPTPLCFHYLCENIQLNNAKNIYPYQVGAYDENQLIHAQRHDKRPFWANGVVLDEFLEQHGIHKVDFIKMDIDGHEPRALKGLIRTIERNPQLKMVIEYFPEYIERDGNVPAEMIVILNKYFTYEKIEGDYGDGYWNYFCKRK